MLVSAFVVAGCSESPQEKYSDATSQLSDAKKQRKEAQEEVSEAKEKVSEAKKALDDAQNTLQEKRQGVISATQAVDKTVNDEVLFRTLQRDLLNQDRFSDAAISVGVNKRIVTLTGTVPDEQTHKQAVEAVRNQAGVADVRDQLQVEKDENAAPHPDNSSQNASGASNNSQNQPDNAEANSNNN